MHDGFKEALRSLSGTKDALLVIIFDGHGTTADGKMLWAPEDAVENNQNMHLDMSDLCSQIMDIHLSEGLFHFGLEAPIKNLYVVILANCCRVQSEMVPSVEHCSPLSKLALFKGARNCANVCIIYSCDPGRTASDSLLTANSPFLEQLLCHIEDLQGVHSLVTAVNDGLREVTRGYQRAWIRDICGNFEGVCLGPRPRRSSSSLLSSVSAELTTGQTLL